MKVLKTVLIGVIPVMAVAVSACSNTSQPAQSSAGKEQAAAPAGGDSPKSGFLVSSKLVNLTIHYHDGVDHIFKDDWPVFAKVQELTNVHLHGTASQSATDSNEVFNMMMASGDLPDIIAGSKLNMNKAALDGALTPLEPLIDKYAPHIKKFFQDNPWAKAGSLASDGKLYYIPYVMDGKPSIGWYVRKDWLDKLGLSAPKTVDEFHSMLKAFRERDPNGNGKKDEVPYISRDSKEGIDYLVPLFGITPDWSVKDGKVVYGKYLPEYKTAMQTIAK